MSTLTTNLRNVDALTLVNRLQELDAAKFDFVQPARTLHSVNAQLRAPELVTDHGVGAVLDMSDDFVGALATRLGVPVAYLRKLYSEMDARAAHAGTIAGATIYDREPLFDQNVNYWLARDEGKVLVRAYVGEDGEGYARALLSDRFRTIDNLDMVMIAQQAIQETGVAAQLTSVDLTDRNMHLVYECPDVAVDGGEFTRGYTYRPRGGHDIYRGADRPLVSAGFVVRNSEVGSAKAAIIPRVVVQVCSNGMTRNVDARSAVHVGARLDEGVQWSARTETAWFDLFRSQMVDAVKHFTTSDYVAQVVRDLNEAGAAEVERPEKAIDHVMRLGIPQERREALLASFISGGQVTVGGLAQAITAVAQDVEDGDLAHEMESIAETVLATSRQVATA